MPTSSFPCEVSAVKVEHVAWGNHQNLSLVILTLLFMNNIRQKVATIALNSDRLADSGACNQSLVSSLILEKPYCSDTH